MSTRALYTFTDDDSSWNVYKHHDGYPSGAAIALKAALKWFAWQLPRFEADDFAAAFCAAGKAHNMIDVAEGARSVEEFTADEKSYGKYSHGGGVRFMPQGNPQEVAAKNCSDIEYRYEVSAPGKDLLVTAYGVDAYDDYSETKLFSGTLDDFAEWANKKRRIALA